MIFEEHNRIILFPFIIDCVYDEFCYLSITRRIRIELNNIRIKGKAMN